MNRKLDSAARGRYGTQAPDTKQEHHNHQAKLPPHRATHQPETKAQCGRGKGHMTESDRGEEDQDSILKIQALPVYFSFQ